MKTAFSTLACPTLSLEEVAAIAARTGMEALEIRLDRDDRLCGFDAEDADRIKGIIDAAGVVISDLATGIFVKTWSPELLPRMERCARLAAAVGARGIRVFVAGEGIHSFDEPLRIDLPGAAHTLKAGAALLRPLGVEIWVETHSEYSTGAIVSSLLKTVDEENMRVIWDILHSIEWGESPAQTVAALGKSIVHVHLKDGESTGAPTDYRLTKMGEGDVDFAAIAAALASIDYHGYLSLEWEQMWHPELEVHFPTTEALLLHYRQFLNRYF